MLNKMWNKIFVLLTYAAPSIKTHGFRKCKMKKINLHIEQNNNFSLNFIDANSFSFMLMTKYMVWMAWCANALTQ